MALELVGGAFLSASLQVLFERMASLEIVDFIRGKKLNEKLLRKMKIMLLSADSVLNDAEKKQISNPYVREWLGHLQEAIYDAEDLLQEINTEAMRCKIEEGFDKKGSSSGGHQVLNLISTTFTTSFNEQVEPKMTEILDRLQFILKQKDNLGLRGGGTVQNRPLGRIPTTSFVEESGVYGRDDDKEAIIKLLLENDHGRGNNMSVIPIVGMGGIGKTTLAQIVYNDERVKECFEFKAWVSVSNEFDIFKITKTVAYRVIGQTFKDDQDLDLVQLELKKALKGQKFFLVLDDVWNEDYQQWEEVKKPFECGAFGSKIIVTTRNESVASVMHDSIPAYHLQTMCDENCWKIFIKHAFNSVDPCAYPELEEIGRQIVKKCQGLPLAVKSLGSLLRSQLNPEDWKNILKSDMWELPTEKNNILPALWLSYQYLPLHLKRCFAYCSVFPKNYKIDRENLIKLWMAEDLLKPQKKKRIEQVGEEAINGLLSRSLFQQVLRESGFEKSPICYTMHDLVHDLATFVAREFCLSLDVSSSNKFLNKVRHLSHEKEQKYDLKKYEYLSTAESLRTFFFPSQCYGVIQLRLQNLVAKSLPALTCLRVLSWNGSSITELPDSIGNLKLLRYLNLCGTNIKEIPTFLCTLYNLQTLILSHCRELKLLPADMGRLINLRHLDLVDTNLERMPLEIGNLKDLQTMTNFVVGKYCGYTMELLRDLQHLHGKLCFSELNNIVKVEDVLMANLKDKKCLTELEFSWGPNGFDNYGMHKAVLNGLEPHTSLKLLKIQNYNGEQFPKWLGDPSFRNLEEIQLEGCGECSILPPLGQLPLLKHLSVTGFDELVKISDEFYCSGCSISARPFRCLEFLKFYDLRKWEEWSLIDSFLDLKKLVLGYCPKLTACIWLPNTIQQVHIEECRNLVLAGIMQHCHGNLQRLEISKSCDNINSIVLDYFPMLEVLSLESCENLESLTCSEQPHPPMLPFLTRFQLKDCPKFISFPHGGLHAPSLEDFCIEDCNMLRSLPGHMNTLLPSLQLLSILNCPELESFPECGLPSKLEHLEISNCNKLFSNRMLWNLQTLTCFHSLQISNMDEHVLDSFPEEGLLPTSLNCLAINSLPHFKALNGNAFQQLSSLKRLGISRCQELQCLPEGLPASLSVLKIYDCPLLKQLCQRDGEDWPKISHIAHIKMDYSCM